MPTLTKARVDAPSIIKKGKYDTLDRFAQRAEMYAKFERCFRDRLSSHEVPVCAKRVAAEGLGQAHEAGGKFYLQVAG